MLSQKIVKNQASLGENTANKTVQKEQSLTQRPQPDIWLWQKNNSNKKKRKFHSDQKSVEDIVDYRRRLEQIL